MSFKLSSYLYVSRRGLLISFSREKCLKLAEKYMGAGTFQVAESFEDAVNKAVRLAASYTLYSTRIWREDIFVDQILFFRDIGPQKALVNMKTGESTLIYGREKKSENCR